MKRGENFIITTQNHDSIQIIIFHAKKFGTGYYVKEESQILADELPYVFQDNQDVEYEVMSTYVAQDIQDAINKLPEHHRTVIVLRYLQDLSYNEIADCLDLPLNTVKSYLFRARQQLQNLLQEYQKGGVTG